MDTATNNTKVPASQPGMRGISVSQPTSKESGQGARYLDRPVEQALVNNYLKPEDLDNMLKKLSLAERDIQWLDAIDGGLTNHNFLIKVSAGEMDGRKLVLRVPGEAANSLVNRAQEGRHIGIIRAAGIDADTVYFDVDSGIKLTGFIDGKTLASEDIAGNFQLITDILRTLHSLPVDGSASFNYSELLSKYERLTKGVDAPLPEEYDTLKKKVLENIDRYAPLHSVCLCHNDLVAENMVLTEDRLYLIDWEYSALNDPVFDLASCAQEAKLDKKQTMALLTSYFKRAPEAEELKRVEVWQQAQDLLWSLWAFYKYKKGEVSMLDYAKERFGRLKDRELS